MNPLCDPEVFPRLTAESELRIAGERDRASRARLGVVLRLVGLHVLLESILRRRCRLLRCSYRRRAEYDGEQAPHGGG